MSALPAGGAARRLRRTRLLMTVSFAAVIAVCLALLAALALSIDATSQRGAVTDDVTERAGGLARAVYFDGGTLHLEPLREDELAVGTSFLAVYRIDASGRVTATPAHLPDPPSSRPSDATR